MEEKENREAREGEVGGVVWVERRLEEVPVLEREDGSDGLLVLGREEERELVGRTENLESGFR